MSSSAPESYTPHYYRRDHLGNVREVWKATDSVALTVQRTRYYPSGLPWEYLAGDSASLQPYKFNGCEFIETHGYDVTDLGNRGVYHAINRFTTMDRFAEKYPWQSPYVHAGNNPVNFVDVGGDSVNIWYLQQWDRQNGTNIVSTLLNDLSEQTGLSYSVSSTGMLTYAKDSEGNPIIATKTDAKGNTVQVGSQTARNIMMNAADHTDIIMLSGGERTGVIPGTNNMAFNVKQLEEHINGAVGVDPKTLGWGMTLMHEIQHTQLGGGLSDYPHGPNNPGPVVRIMNMIRTELNAQGGNYGQRLEYEATPQGLNAVIPFNRQAQSAIQAGWTPLIYPNSKFIKF